MDVSFYVFSLPFFMIIWGLIIGSVFFTGIFMLIYYLPTIKIGFSEPDIHTGQISENQFNIKKTFPRFRRNANIHLGILGSLFFVLISVKHYFSQFSILYSKTGVVVGAGYSDVIAYLPLVKFLMVLAIMVAILFIIKIFYFSKNPKLKKRHIFMYFLGVYVLFAFMGPIFIPGIVQSLIVEPNEVNLESPYI